MAEKPRSSTSRKLLRRFASGEEPALDELLRLELPKMLRRVAARLPKRLRARVGASDILQQAAVSLVAQRERFEDRGVLAFRQLLNTVIDHVLVNAIEHEDRARRAVGRERKRGARAPSDGASTFGRLPKGATSPSQQLVREEDLAIMQRSFTALSAIDQEMIQLIDYDNLSYEEVASALGVAVTTARQRHHRAVERLRLAMRRARGVAGRQ